MKKTLLGFVGAAVVASGILSGVAGATGNSVTTDLTFTSSQKSTALLLGGSSFDEPFFNAAIPGFMSESANKAITGSNSGNAPQGISLYNPVGSTSGKKGVAGSDFVITSGSEPTQVFHIGASDVPMGSGDVGSALNKYVQVPVVFGGVALMINDSKLNTLLGKTKNVQNQLVVTAAQLAKIYLGQITNWNDTTFCALNTKICTKKVSKGKTTFTSKVQSLTISPVFRADGSGTSYIFMDYLHKADPSDFTASPSTTFPGSGLANGIGAQKNAGVAADTEQTPGAIGYVEYSYVLAQHSLPTISLVNAANQAVQINTTSITASVPAGIAPSETDGAVTNFSTVNSSVAKAWPITGYSWAIVRKNLTDATVNGTADNAATTTVATQFLDWAVQAGTTSVPGGQHYAQQQGYIPLSADVTAFAQAQIAKIN